MPDLSVTLGRMHLASPLLTASGTSGHGGEITVLKDSEKILSCLGAFVTKGVTLAPRAGNPGVRVAECACGMLNAIGLQNKGAEEFTKTELPGLLAFNLPVVVNISASTREEFKTLAARLLENDSARIISALEINVSCPNVSRGGAAFGADPEAVLSVVRAVRSAVGPDMTLITKLSPNVTDITAPAAAAIEAGTDVLSMINTLRGLAIDVETGRPVLGNRVGGLSGPAIRPVGVYMVWACYSGLAACRSGQVPIIGIGGISTWSDAMEYVLAGASAVGIGTAWFLKPTVFVDVLSGITDYVHRRGVPFRDLVGLAHQNSGQPAPSC